MAEQQIEKTEMTQEQVAAEEQVRQAEIVKLKERAAAGAEKAELTAVSTANAANASALMRQFATKGAAGRDQTAERRKAEATALVQPALSKAHGLITRHAMLRNKSLQRAYDVANLNIVDVLSAVKEEFVMGEQLAPGGTRVPAALSRNHRPLRQYHEAAKLAVDALNSTLGSEQQGPKDFSPVGLSVAVKWMENELAAGDTHYYSEEKGTDSLMPAFANTHRQLLYWIDKAEKIVAAAAAAAERFERAEVAAREVLQRVTATEPTGSEPERVLMQRAVTADQVPPVRERGGSSFVDWDPREEPKPEDTTKVTPLLGGGARVVSPMKGA